MRVRAREHMVRAQACVFVSVYVCDVSVCLCERPGVLLRLRWLSIFSIHYFVLFSFFLSFFFFLFSAFI